MVAHGRERYDGKRGGEGYMNTCFGGERARGGGGMRETTIFFCRRKTRGSRYHHGCMLSYGSICLLEYVRLTA